ncbi:MAG: sensor domain-containing diguanylate cyclase [Planctomycetota bacterium]|nr:sensor domain-containing diguanylate cyclase [Planctomycetota bacterium]
MLRRRIEERAQKDPEWGAVMEYVGALERELADERRKMKRMRLDLETVIETVSQVNAKSLDTELIENFTLNTAMGQVAAQRAFIMRQGDTLTDEISVTVTKNVKVPRLRFRKDGELASALIEKEAPFELSGNSNLMKHSVYRKILEMDMELCIPLIKRHENGEKELKGLMVLGKKFNKMGYTERDKEFLSLLGAMVAISLHNAQLYHRSIYDEMTQVFSRGHFDAHLFQEVERAKRYHSERDGSPYQISLIMFDIDDFKHFNDTYGHQIGDTILKGVANVVKRSVRTSDMVSRYGGEEFCVVLPETNKENALRAAERLRKAISNYKVTTREYGELSVTVSMGVATYPDDADSVQELVREADKALYVAKGRGKNCVVEAEREDADKKLGSGVKR